MPPRSVGGRRGRGVAARLPSGSLVLGRWRARGERGHAERGDERDTQGSSGHEGTSDDDETTTWVGAGSLDATVARRTRPSLRNVAQLSVTRALPRDEILICGRVQRQMSGDDGSVTGPAEALAAGSHRAGPCAGRAPTPSARSPAAARPDRRRSGRTAPAAAARRTPPSRRRPRPRPSVAGVDEHLDLAHDGVGVDDRPRAGSNCACRRSRTTLPISANALWSSSTTQAPTRLLSRHDRDRAGVARPGRLLDGAGARRGATGRAAAVPGRSTVSGTSSP